jgi:hypothetical protein
MLRSFRVPDRWFAQIFQSTDNEPGGVWCNKPAEGFATAAEAFVAAGLPDKA